jgi:hypothetical protein
LARKTYKEGMYRFDNGIRYMDLLTVDPTKGGCDNTPPEDRVDAFLMMHKMSLPGWEDDQQIIQQLMTKITYTDAELASGKTCFKPCREGFKPIAQQKRNLEQSHRTTFGMPIANPLMHMKADSSEGMNYVAWFKHNYGFLPSEAHNYVVGIGPPPLHPGE